MIEQLKAWLEVYPGIRGLTVDFVDRGRENGGLYPMGIREISRKTDVCGGVTVRNRGTFQLRFAMERGADSARWLLDFQNWIQKQGLLGQVPRFGDKTERVSAGKGRLAQADDAMGLYSMELTVEWTAGSGPGSL